jgi:hypothetical protein
MANKIYDFLPAHLRNRELEDIFDATLERVFSKGNLEKTRAFVGRREKGLNNEDDTYLSFPKHLFQRDNYGFEPVFTNDNIGDRVFYEDLLNAMYNKGMLTNDHRRLFESKRKTINLPIDVDKFINWQLYYWVRPQPLYYHVLDENGFGTYVNDDVEHPVLKPYRVDGKQVYVNHLGLNMTSNTKPEYITIDDGGDNYWSKTNSWEHHEDIRKLMSNAPGATKIDINDFILSSDTIDTSNIYYIKNDNTHLFIQAQRPIIEFDRQLEISSDVEDYNWRVPRFKLYDLEGNPLDDDFSIFEYVQDELFTPDPVLGIDVKTVSGDYASEFVFQITMPDNSLYKLGDEFQELYIDCEFNYRNLRREYGRGTFTNLELPQRPVTSNDIDVYVNGIKQIANYSVTEEAVTFDKAIDGDVYIDLCTKDPVDLDGDTVWQRLNPILEYNIDNERHNQKEFTYSVFYEHFLRQLETTEGLQGEANASNNYRNIGNGFEKTRFNHNGSVMVIHDTDVRKGYFSITRDDYDPIKAIEFLASAYASYKNKLVLKVQELLKEDFENTKTNLEILETAIGEIALLKRENIDVFSESDMMAFGELYNHYTQGRVNTILGSFEHFVPAEMQNKIVNEENAMVIVNDTVMKLQEDYKISDSGNEIIFKTYMVQPEDEVYIRYYDKLAETFIPPSAVSLGLSELFVPKTFVDDEYEPSVTFIRGHDGSTVPAWGDRTDDIMIMFENLVYNRNTDKSTQKSDLNLGMYLYESEYTFAEKRYTMYPFFKKWMIKNNIDDTRNTQFDVEDWKTWNYRAISDLVPGSYRSVLSYIYNTEFIFEQPWLVLGLTERPKEALFGWVNDNTYIADSGYFKDIDFTSYDFWTSLKSRAEANWPIPVDVDGNLIETGNLLSVVIDDKQILKQDWEFGDGSPEELAWRRSSEYPFIEFITKILLKPFIILDVYDDKLRDIIDIYNKREGYSAASIIAQRNNYKFKLGSKLGGFVNNFKLYSERNSFANTSKSEIPSDNYDLFIHAGEPNRSESFSAIIIEKVSLDEQYPSYKLLDTEGYLDGDIVLRHNDKKYYRRMGTEQSDNELDNIALYEETDDDTILDYFDYSQWALVTQPSVRKFGYRVSGYDDFNPVFYTLDWDKQSGQKRWTSSGDYANIKQWNAGEYYRNDIFATYNNKPYISLSEHEASESFDNDLRDGNWKLLREWPITNTVDAVGYKEVLSDQLKIHNYGDILESLDEVAQLFVGYQEYLKVVGWDFTDLDDFSEPVDFEHLIKDFLDWSRQAHKVGEFITLTPIMRTGRFATPYGVANIGKTTNKNFYRVVDSSGRQLGKDMVKFNIDGDGIAWESTVPVYGIKVDIQDVEHAFVIDREDSYGDMIYDPLSHNRNLRMLVDCNRTSDWDGTLSIDGFLASGGQLLPNIETMVEDTRYYRDTLVDQSLEIVNKLKESQLGFAPKMYLTNHFIDRESQVEFHKGFLAGKSTKSSINRLINKKSNFEDTTHEEVWAFKLDDYGKTKNRTTSSIIIPTIDINSDPFTIRWSENNQFKINDSSYFRTAPIKTSGYVNPDDVNYVVRNNSILESTVRDTFYEGDTAWIRFDDEREWDVKRLSEIAEIAYVGETADGQLYVGLTNEINIDDAVFLKINSVDIDPVVNGYFNLVDDGEKVQNGQTIYEYLVFDTEYEPFVVEIDETTDNSVFVPTPSDTGVEAIGSVSNPSFVNGDKLVINGNDYIFDASNTGTTFGLTIGGASATTDPFVTTGEEARIVVYDENNSQLNPNTVVRFDGTKLRFDQAVSSNEGDVFTINGVSVTVDYSSETTITATSSVDTDTNIASGLEMTFSSNFSSTTVETQDIQIAGTVNNPTLASTKALSVNGTVITFTVPAPITGNDSIETFQSLPSPVSSLNFANDMTYFLPGEVTVSDGTTTTTLTSSDYTYLNGVLTFNTPVVGTLGDYDNDPLTPDTEASISFSVELIAQPVPQTVDVNYIISTINASSAPITASLVSNKLVIDTGVSNLSMSGSVLQDLGLSTTTSLQRSKLADIAEQINNISYMTAIIDSSNKLVFTTNNDELTLSGQLAVTLGIGEQTFESTTNPTSASIAAQINNSGIPSVSAESVGGILTVIYDGAEMTVSEVTSGAMSRLGLTSGLSSKTVKSIDTIIDDINEILPSNTRAEKYAGTDRLVITSSAKRVELINYLGNPWDDIGIATGDYVNNNTSNTAAQAFKDQINLASTDVVVSVSSDGRMIFTSSGRGIGFGGTSAAVLEKIGLYENYSSTKSNANFKIMRWKSVRYTPNYVHNSFDEFLTDLGLNSYSKIWADDYRDLGWAVLGYSTTNSEPEFIARQCHDIVDVEDIKRMVVRDGETFYTYQLFDPLNLKLPGSITKDIDYVDWQDPAKYDDEYSNDLWLSEHVGEIWWDTDLTRYYRYKDYGDANGKIDVDFVKRYWGKIVPGSKVEIKQWKSASAVPEDIQWFNTETRWDTDSNRSVTTYYFWSTVGIEVEDKEYTIDEIKMLIESGGTTNKFLPIDDRTVITSNSTNLNSTEIEYTVYKQNAQDLETKHVDWQLLSRNSTSPVDKYYLNELRDSLSGGLVELVDTIIATDDQTEFTDAKFLDRSISDTVISINNNFVDVLSVVFNNDTIIVEDTPIYEGDVVRIYAVSQKAGWFKNLFEARSNFSSIVNDYMKRKMLTREIPLYHEHIGFGTGIFVKENWAISSDFDTVKRYEYLSKTRDFDMIKMFRNGTNSFKVDLPDEAEFYFEYLGNLRLVHKENAALRVQYPDYTRIQNQSDLAVYYDNVMMVQTHELIEMLYIYADIHFVKNMFFDMIDYMYTEKTYPDWIFKTSYIDLYMLNKPLRQYAIYQNDNYDDIIDYVNETKPYHTKIRETERVYPYGETFQADVDIYEAMEITLFFGGHSRYKDNVVDGGDVSDTDWRNTEHLGVLSYVVEKYFEDEGKYLYTGLDDYTLDSKMPEGLRRLYHIYTYNKHLIRLVRENSNHELTFDQQETINEWNSLVQQFMLDPNNEYDAGFFLRRFNTLTNEPGGYDTGEFGARVTEAMVIKIKDDNEDNPQFVVYDSYGRGYYMEIDGVATLDGFDGNYFTSNYQNLRHAKDETHVLLALENNNGDIEFMMYDQKKNNKYRISHRALFNGLSSSFTAGDIIYILSSPRRIIDGEVKKLFDIDIISGV